MQSRAEPPQERVDVWDEGWKVESYDDLLRNMGIEIVDGTMVATTSLPASLATHPPPTSMSVALKPKGGGGGGGGRGRGRGNGRQGRGGRGTDAEQTGPGFESKDPSLTANANANASSAAGAGFVPNSNLVPVPQPAPAVAPELQNSYIFNKYFRKELAQQQQSAIPRPGTVEYVNYRLRNYLEWLRIQKIKSKKMTFY